MTDASAVANFLKDGDIAIMTKNIPYPYDIRTAENWISTHEPLYNENKLVNFAIVLYASNILIGTIGLQIRKQISEAELGYWIGKPYWNQGFCTEAAKAALQYGFNDIGLSKISANTLNENLRSKSVLKKIGMHFENINEPNYSKDTKLDELMTCYITKP